MDDKLYIMSKDTVTAIYENRQLTVLNRQLLPLFLKNFSDVDSWLITRAIDSHRANSRLIKKALRLKERDDISTVIKVNAASITDCYWVKQSDSKLTYNDVRFCTDYFSELALNGSFDSLNNAYEHKDCNTPELTNTGSFEKCWKLVGGKWYMYKKANENEQFSEIFICRLGKALGMNMVEYFKGDDCVITPDFTDAASVNFEPAFCFMLDNEDYNDVISALEKLYPKAIPDYIKMLFLDTVCSNPDRHTGNFGLLRDTDTGEFVGFAPCFDHNMALVSRGYPKMNNSHDLLVELFAEMIEEHPQYAEYIPEIDHSMVKEIAESIDLSIDKDFVADYVMNKYDLLTGTLQNQKGIDFTRTDNSRQ